MFTKKKKMKNLVGMVPCAEDGPLGMSFAHHELNTQALYVAVWRVAPFPPLLLIHTQEAPIQPRPGWGEVGALL